MKRTSNQDHALNLIRRICALETSAHEDSIVFQVRDVGAGMGSPGNAVKQGVLAALVVMGYIRIIQKPHSTLNIYGATRESLQRLGQDMRLSQWNQLGLRPYTYIVHAQVRLSENDSVRKFAREWNCWTEVRSADLITVKVDGFDTYFFVNSRMIGDGPPIHLCCGLQIIKPDLMDHFDIDCHWKDE